MTFGDEICGFFYKFFWTQNIDQSEATNSLSPPYPSRQPLQCITPPLAPLSPQPTLPCGLERGGRRALVRRRCHRMGLRARPLSPPALACTICYTGTNLISRCRWAIRDVTSDLWWCGKRGMEKEKKTACSLVVSWRCATQTLRHFVRVRDKSSIKYITYIIEGYYISMLLIIHMWDGNIIKPDKCYIIKLTLIGVQVTTWHQIT